MADTGDLKSPVRIERTGSSPVDGTIYYSNIER